MHLKANGISIHYRIDGPDAAPWLIFSNSLATDLSMWEPQTAELSKAFRILRYDQRGHGKTEAPGGRYSFDTLMADVVALMDELSIERAHFCGLSMGGSTAMGMAQNHSNRLDRVIVCDSPCFSTAAATQQWEERIAVARSEGMEGLVESTLARWYPADTLAASPPQVSKVREMILATPVNGFAGCAAALATHDFRSNIGAVKLPMLLVAGEKDGVVPAAMQDIHREMSTSQFVSLPNAGHISNLDQPALFSNALSEFLAE
ncbi:3-oxoadipate enol-lactonase [Rhodoligotrophos appendicifer]|uniref:3-oxoadipate enol-lactonase n=1 Tax=Rhodoligotrophos appendicifer TaxID=987056 RepID=UPI0019620B0F|nr:3-oxoadipate enol-lactonase [Rhodoligotrophos appendicifer]